MRLGIGFTLSHSSPSEWADRHAALGLRSVVFPVGPEAPASLIEAYVQAAAARDLLIAEVGAWVNPMDSDPKLRAANRSRCVDSLALAERVHARCCVAITGSAGPVWDGPDPRNYDPSFRQEVVKTIQSFVDTVHPVRTRWTSEPMPWMTPDSPEDYQLLLRQIDRPDETAVHLDPINMITSPDRYFHSGRFFEHCFELLGPSIRSCHLKDARLENRLTFHVQECMVGDGALDLRRYLELIDAQNPELPVIIEHLGSEAEYKEAIRRVHALR